MFKFKKYIPQTLVAALIVCLVMLPSASAQTVMATLGDQNSSNEYRVKVTRDTVTQTAILTYASNTGIVYPYQASHDSSATNTLTLGESGNVVIDNVGAKHTLANCTPGAEFTVTAGFYTQGTTEYPTTFTVDTSTTGERILFSTSGTMLDAGDSVKSSGQAGDSVTLRCSVDSQEWAVIDMNGTFSDNGTN